MHATVPCDAILPGLGRRIGRPADAVRVGGARAVEIWRVAEAAGDGARSRSGESPKPRATLRALRDRQDEFEALGVRVFGVSRDSPYSHRAYAQQQWLNFPLLTDWSGDAVRGFGVNQEFDGLADSPVRSCFLIDGDGTVRAAWSYGDDELPDVDEVLAAARDL
jgi:peroxiredoxin